MTTTDFEAVYERSLDDVYRCITVLTAHPDGTRVDLQPSVLGGSYLAVDGTIVGFGSEATC